MLKYAHHIHNIILKRLVEDVYVFVEKEHFRIILLEIVQIDVLQAQTIILTILREDVFFIVHNILKPLLIIQLENVYLFVLLPLIFMGTIKLYVAFLNAHVNNKHLLIILQECV